MKPNTYYFPHDYNARRDPKIIRLIRDLKMDGYGTFWSVVEMLYDSGGFLLESEIPAYAWELRISEDNLKSVIYDYGLFKIEDGRITSDSALRRLEVRAEKSTKYRNNALKRWLKGDSDNGEEKNDENTKNGNPKKPAKKPKPVFRAPTLEQVKAFFFHQGVKNDEYAKFFDYYSSKNWKVGNVSMSDWLAAARRWLRNDYPGIDIRPCTVEDITSMLEEAPEQVFGSDGYEKPNLAIL